LISCLKRRLSCNIKIIDERKKGAGQKEKIFIFAASKNAVVRHWGARIILLHRLAYTVGRGLSFARATEDKAR
jgi:hypothetical protein